MWYVYLYIESNQFLQHTTSIKNCVAIVDKLPAGFEPVLVLSKDQKKTAWADHENMREEGAQVFVVKLKEGEYHYSYRVRATTTGTYHAPAARAEEMYSPDVSAQSCSINVVIY